MNADWRTFHIRAMYRDESRTWSETFYAPDLDTAFALARARWPSAVAWEHLHSTGGSCY